MENNSSPDKNVESIKQMFNRIAPSYDLLNHTLSMGIDKYWRKKLLKDLKPYKPENILDIASGTGDLALLLAAKTNAKLTAIDISESMLAIAEKKCIKSKLTDKINFVLADAEQLPFEENKFDAAVVAFGVRNFENLQKGLIEIKRVLKPDAPFFILELTAPPRFPLKQIYKLYFSFILPFAGRIISKDKTAYTYLPSSVYSFPSGVLFINELNKAGFKKTSFINLSGGIVTLYNAVK